jgi:hypothetical protein
MAAKATFALKAGVWFRRGLWLIFSPESRGLYSPLSGRRSTYRPVRISETTSVIAIAFAPVQQKRQGLRSGPPDYFLLNAQEINHQTLKAAAAIKLKELKASRAVSG